MRIQSKLFLSHFLAILLVSGSIGTYFYNGAIDNLEQSLRSRLKYSAALLSQSFDTQDLDQIRVAADAGSAIFARNVTHLRSFAEANPDIAFIYVMRNIDGKPYFVIDSDEEEPAAPGELYDEHIPELMSGFKRLSVDSEITVDRWGSFLSGYAPIKGASEEYLIGIDMHAEEVQVKLSDLKTKGFLSLLMSVALAYVCCFFLAKSFLRRINTLHKRCVETGDAEAIIQKRQGDELDELNHVFGLMLEQQDKIQEELERKVKARTSELEQSNASLKTEIEERGRIASQLAETARTDYLTGIANRREISRLLFDYEQQYTRNLTTFSLILFDLDGFKALNDKYGHAVGDEVLKAVVKRLRCIVRDQDVIGRWGGEEFIVLLPLTEQTDAVLIAEKMRAELETSSFEVDEYFLRVTSSFGVAEYHPHGGLKNCLRQADLALYRAKQGGRNKVSIAEEYFAESS